MIVLLTDFGESEYVGVMKGVIYGICPETNVVDLCHQVSPQCVTEASWILSNNYPYFAPGSVFCCVVDPGVGTERKALAVKAGDYYFVGPDNGLLWETLKVFDDVEIRQADIPAGTSKTFHGRDVFAKVAAQIELGNFAEAGQVTDRIDELDFYRDDREGIVVRVDPFGNVVTNLPSGDQVQYRVTVGPHDGMLSCHDTYDEARDGELFVVEGSCKTLELSVKNGSANEALKVGVGERIHIT